MFKTFRKNIVMLLITFIFFTIIFNMNSLKIVRADILNSVIENKETKDNLDNSNYLIIDENTSIDNKKEVLNGEKAKNTDQTIQEINKEERDEDVGNSSEDNLEENIESDKNINTESSINIDSANKSENENSQSISSENSRSLISGGNIVGYQAHVSNIGWQEWVSNGLTAGTTGKSLPIEALNIKLEGLQEGVSLNYRSHISKIGWQEWVSNGTMTGTTGKALSIEAIEIKLEGNNTSYDIMYRVHIRDIGWQERKSNGELAGTTGKAKPIEAIEIKLVEKQNISELKYQTHVSNEGWTDWSLDGVTSGSTIDTQVEAFKLILNKGQESIIRYRSYIRNTGWQEWKSSGEISGTEGRNLPIEQIEIALNNAPDRYTIEYRIRTKNTGWNEWKQDGQTASSNGDIITGIQVKIKDNNSIPYVSYQTHVRDIGWQNNVSNGEMAGTTGRALSIEAIKIDYKVGNLNSGILYKAHIQDIGWQEWVSNSEVAGTTGRSKPIEAIQIKQEVPIKGYKLKYRVHIRDIGWQEWKSEGEVAGTTGQSKPIEAIEIKFDEDNLRTIVIDPGHNFGGDDGAYATHYGTTYIERDINMQIAMKLKNTLESKGFNIVLTRNPNERETIDMRKSIEKRVNIANSSDAELFISIHQNASTYAEAKGVEVYYSSAKPNNGNANSNKIDISRQLAENISRSLSSYIGSNNRGAKDDDFYVVKNTIMASVLIECGFITNYEEVKKLVDLGNQQKMAEVIADEVIKLIN